MNESTITEVIDGVTFELRPFHKRPTNADWICLRKSQSLVDQYRAMATELQNCNMVEVGIDQGGSTAFFAKLYRPRQLLAIELSKNPLPKLMNFMGSHEEGRRIKLHLGVDQADRVEVPRLVDEVFGSQALDIVVDDASHLLEPSTTTFEMLFPKLREGGVYVIEDWSGVHAVEHAWMKELAADPDGTNVAKFEAATAAVAAAAVVAVGDVEYPTPVSLLICQLLIGSAFNPDWIAGIRAVDGICEIRRGGAKIEPGTPIASYIGPLGQGLFNTSAPGRHLPARL